MENRYLIIKHASLNYGLLLKRENADVGKIYFAESKAAKSVILSHPYLAVAENINLRKFVSLGLYEGLFDEQTKKSAQEYLDNSIKDMHVSENECYGSINDGDEYQLKITIDSNSYITISCTCNSTGPCKHLYAAFLTAKKLIDSKQEDNVASQSAKQREVFKDIIEKTIHSKGEDRIPFIKNICYQIKSVENCELFLDQLLPYYQRSQYEGVVIVDILAPLFADDNVRDNFKKIIELNKDEINKMLLHVEKAYQLLKKRFEEKPIDNEADKDSNNHTSEEKSLENETSLEFTEEETKTIEQYPFLKVLLEKINRLEKELRIVKEELKEFKKNPAPSKANAKRRYKCEVLYRSEWPDGSIQNGSYYTEIEASSEAEARIAARNSDPDSIGIGSVTEII